MSYEFEDRRRIEEMEELQLVPEASEAIKATIINMGEVSPESPILVGCSDDRAPTQENVDSLNDAGLPMERPYIRIFGAGYGAANLLVLTTTAQYGPDGARQRIGEDFNDVYTGLSARAADLGVILATHSDETAEGGPSGFDPKADGKIACAKAANLGAINQISRKEQLAIRQAESESEDLLGDDHNESARQIASAVGEAAESFFGGQPDSFAVKRQDVAEQGLPVMVLEGKHEKSKDVKHVLILEPNKVSDPLEAQARGANYYSSDVVSVGELLMRCYPELDLDPVVYMQTAIADAAGTRMALAALDGPSDPSRIESVRVGSGRQALDYLYGVKESLS